MEAIEFYPPMSGEIVKKLTVIESVMMFFDQVTPKNIIEALSQGLSLQVVVLAILIGIALGVTRTKQTKNMLSLVKAIDEIFKSIFGWLLYVLPFGLCGLFAQIGANFNFMMISTLMRFVILFYIVGIFLLLVYQIIFCVFSKTRFFHSLKVLKRTMILTFLVESSVITLPLTLSALEELKIDKKIAGLIMPLGVVINQHGKVLFFALLTIFICNLYGIHLSVYNLIFIFISSDSRDGCIR